MNLESLTIRKTFSKDFTDIMKVEELAFGHYKEAQLTAELLSDRTAEPLLSLLAFHNNKAAGHILFTSAYIKDGNDQPMMHILAPLAVIPEFQKKGIGGMLILKGLEMLKEMGSELVFVLGHMDYYPRYGFIPDADNLGFPAPYPIPDKFKNAWMVQSLCGDISNFNKGNIICADQLNKPEHWRE